MKVPSMEEWINLIKTLVTATLTLGMAWFMGYYFLTIITGEISPDANDHVNTINGGMIALLGVFSKIMLDAFTERFLK